MEQDKIIKSHIFTRQNEHYFYEVLGGVEVTIKPQRGKEPHLRKECESEPVLYLSSYGKSVCPFISGELKISGNDLITLGKAIDWAFRESEKLIKESEVENG